MVTTLRHPPVIIASDITDAVMTVIAAAIVDQNALASPYPITAARIYQQRRIRDRIFGDQADMFSDPAWDIMLDLFASHTGRKRISVSSACIAARVPATTALRHLRGLIERGFVERIADDVDHRRHFVQLTEYGHAQMHGCLAGISGDVTC